MPVLQRSRGIWACKPHGGQTQGSLLRALSDDVKCPGERQPLVLPARLRLHDAATAITLWMISQQLMGAFPPDSVRMKLVTFLPQPGPSGLTGGHFWHKLSDVWRPACEKALYWRPRNPSSSLLPYSRSSS